MQPTHGLPADTSERPARKAASLGIPPEALALPALEQVATDPPANGHPLVPPADEWVTTFNAWMAAVEARGDRYPPGRVTDVSREACMRAAATDDRTIDRFQGDKDVQLTLDIPKDTYDRLARKATTLGTTPEALALPALERAAAEPPANGPPPVSPAGPAPADPAPAGWRRLFDAHMRAVEARADRYPPGHVTDVSREAMYEGCGE